MAQVPSLQISLIPASLEDLTTELNIKLLALEDILRKLSFTDNFHKNAEEFVASPITMVSGVIGYTGGAGGAYTDEQAQDAVGNILVDTTTINHIYDDGTPQITSHVIPGGVNHDVLLNTHNLTTDIDHDALTNFLASEHFTQAAISITEAQISDLVHTSNHLVLSNIGTNSHASIDTHIAAANPHSGSAPTAHTHVEADVTDLSHTTNHLVLSNIGINSHSTIDTHIADGTKHFLEGSIDHVNISNIGTNTHAQVDTHIAAANPHSGSAPTAHTHVEADVTDLSHYSTADFTTDLNAASVDKHADVDTTTSAPALNEVLKWNGSEWVPGTAGDTAEFTFSIDSFSDGVSDTNQLIGSGVWKAITALSFTATYSNAPGGMTAEVAMSGASNSWASNLSMTPVTGPETNTEAVNYPSSSGSSVIFTLSQSVDASTSQESVAFNNTMRYGNSTLTQGNQTQASIEALSEIGGPNESRSQSINNIATTANYLAFSYADRLSDIKQVRRNIGFGLITASFNSARTTVAPSVQTGIASVANSAGFAEAFAAITSTDTGLANGTNDFQILTSLSAQNYIFWGELNKSASYTEADVEDNTASEPGQVASNSMSSRSMTVNAGASEYTYIAYPARLGALTSIIIGGFESIGDFNVDNTALAITNDAGFTEDYRVYVSQNPGFTDPTTMTVTI